MSNFWKNSGWSVGIIISLLPLLLWWVKYPPTYYLEDLHLVYGLFAKSASLVGTAMFAYSLILSTRLLFIEAMFNGLDKLYKAHRKFAVWGFTLILLHPFFLTFKWAVQPELGVSALWASPDLALILGRLAMGLFIFALFFSVMLRVKHQTFLKIHRLLGVAFILGAWHALLVPGQLDVNAPLNLYMITLFILAAIAYLYHSVFGAYFVKRYKYLVKEVRVISDSVIEIVLRRKGRPIIFTPGQFAFLSLEDPIVDSESHPFALTSDHHHNEVSMVIKTLGDWTGRIKDVSPGSRAYLEGPFGRFSYLNTRNRNQVWIAGGIGVTPFLSMARSLRKNSRHNIDFYYCYKTPEEAVFWDELEAIAKKHPTLRLIGMCETTDGFLSAKTIAKESGDLTKLDFFICGPPGMMAALKKQLLEAEVPDRQLHLEEFSF